MVEFVETGDLLNEHPLGGRGCAMRRTAASNEGLVFGGMGRGPGLELCATGYSAGETA